jgi:hypothetical protein
MNHSSSRCSLLSFIYQTGEKGEYFPIRGQPAREMQDNFRYPAQEKPKGLVFSYQRILSSNLTQVYCKQIHIQKILNESPYTS